MYTVTMPKSKTYNYEVTGKGEFPIDMLRYDRALPRHEGDSTQIGRTHAGGTKEHTVSLTSDVKAPTVGRWQSFGWRVENVEVTS